MIMPYLEFCNLLLLGCNSREKTKIQRIQNKGLKIATAETGSIQLDNGD